MRWIFLQTVLYTLILSILRICGHLFSFLFSAKHVYRILSVVSSSVLWYETSVLFERIWSKLLGTLRHQFWKVGKLRLGAEGRGKSDTARTWRADGTLCRLLPHRPPLLNAPGPPVSVLRLPLRAILPLVILHPWRASEMASGPFIQPNQTSLLLWPRWRKFLPNKKVA